MASTKSLEDMLLSSDIDESAVSALVGSLESQLSSSDAHYPRNELSATSMNNNHIQNASVADCTTRMPDAQKHGALLGSLLEQGSQNTNKTLVNSQIMGLNSVSSQNLSNAVIVSLAGALPASGYLNQVSSTQQALLNSSVVSRHVSSADIKLVYSPHSTTSAFSPQVTSSIVTSGVITNNINRNNYKVTTLQNGSPNFSAGQQIATATSSGGPVLSGPQVSGATMSAMQNLANIASQQPRIQVANPGGQHLAQQQLNALNAKNPPPRNPVDTKVKQNVINNHANSATDHQHSPSPTMSNHYQVLSGSQAASVITTKTTQVSHMSSPSVNVVTQVVSNPSMLAPGVQIVNVNSTRFGQKTLAPRGLLVGNQVRIAPQMIRQGTPVVPGQGAIALPPGMRSAIVVRADGSQYHLFNVSPPGGIQASNANSPNTTYRLQSLSGTAVPGIIRTLSHQQVVTVPVSSAAVKTLQTGPGSIVRTISPQQMSSSSQVKSQPSTVVSTVLQQTTTSITRSTSSAATSSGQMSPDTIKTKCQNFLSTLIRLAGDETTKTASNVKKLIQNLIDGVIEPEEFSTQLQKELQSNHQPYLIHFLKKSLPHVRQALISGEMTIEGIRPPPVPASMQSLVPTTQIGTLRPILAPTTRGIVSSTGGNSALAAQLSQPLSGNTILTQRLISPHVPQSIARPVRPITIVSTTGSSTSYSGLVQSSPATVGALQSKIVLPKQVSIIKSTSTPKEKKSFVSVRDEDDINDVAAMGGVNLVEESQRILATNSELIGSQIRSCKDDNHFLSSSLHRKVLQIAKKHGLEEVRSEVVDLISHAAEKRLKTIIEKLSILAEHRCENPKNDPRYEVTNDVKAQIKFLEELDKLEKKRHDDQEKEILLKAAKSRSKLEDPELLKLKQKAKEMQRAEIEELRQREANMTALLAIGPRKKFKPDPGSMSGDQAGNGESSGSNNSGPKPPVRPRVKRVILRDLLFAMENDSKTIRRPLLYKYYAR
ncbi:transcription initiation factor TFIID subunit 4-like [Argiope bruennichi]|uniref:Transcription initiation factor TFIID subunit 4 like protein n=1 Tax=Argiope bruennichi TaxID=94029 RepID=A0A8T0FD16_ARGBR|nr:transcription initiation factor TFIID subunit 4-like [Argiope bruennichi]KAF8788148.1 Transcription initiation factor TFIID subunit 4 like protein [Argiope bruennichi]